MTFYCLLTKLSFDSSIIFNFFDNSTVAGIITTILITLLGGYIYKIQKGIDRRDIRNEKLSGALMLLEEHCKAANLIIDRLTNTYKAIIEESSDQSTVDNFLKNTVPSESSALGIIINDTIPKDYSKVESIASLYFGDNSRIQDIIKEIFERTNEWHEFIVKYPIDQANIPFDPTKRVSEVPELSLEKIDKSIMKIMDLIK